MPIYVQNKVKIFILPLNICKHCIENPTYVFPEKEAHGLSPNSYIHVSVSDLYEYIPRIGPHKWLKQNRQTDHGNI